ncbi:cytochrome o ubiquinol oxidase subunit III [Buchnera aphidicola (Neophyllaphis varicolor)]|uniref:cytochrome o ubiquinol oxidase subunit III n=1 Tax=Buchnera aphidicola TaxID=9 RepID=UPI0031B81A6A
MLLKISNLSFFIKSKLKYNFSNHSISENKSFLGLWIYLMSDCIVFAVLFATYAVIINTSKDLFLLKSIFNIPLVIFETFLLLFSSIMYSFAVVFLKLCKYYYIIISLFLTLFAGSLFVLIEGYEFHNLIIHHYGPQFNSLFSIYFTIIGIHGLHVIIGIIWIISIIFELLYIKKISKNIINKIFCLSIFWHFIDIIWICVFSIIYLIGTLL